MVQLRNPGLDDVVISLKDAMGIDLTLKYLQLRGYQKILAATKNLISNKLQ